MRKISLIGLLLAGAVALGCGAGSTDQGGSGISGDSGAGTEEKAGAKVAKVGDAVRDGKFEFTVKSVKCGVRKVGTDLLGATAQGQFCLVTVNVKNIGKEPQSFSDSNQKAYAADGTEYSTDSEAGLYANKDADALFNEINPGNGITGVLVFDIPKGGKLAKLELHDSLFSGGITVQLG
ncbi:DUF4352 domain-containing protein [Plantactinospora sp. B6F1]|uniref:DUF4352 domain-containing protein n=1 Tax=Plantactinospora sp. B6F1 TaxID=3158971 RepID=UPI0032D913EC